MPKHQSLTHYRAILLTMVLVLIIGIVAGCAAPPPTSTPSPVEAAATVEAVVTEVAAAYALAGTAWTFAYFGPPEASVPVMPDTRASVNYFIDRYAGFDGCNWFLGAYTATADGELRNFTPSSTRNVCEPPELQDQSDTFVSALLNSIEFEMDGEQLAQNTSDDQRLLTLDPAPIIPMPGTVWELKFWWVADSEQYAPVLPESMTTMTFEEGGQASGFGGCNDFTIEYEGDLQIEKVLEATDTYAELPSLTFGPITSQPVSCDEPEGIMDQEQSFFAALGTVEYYFKLGGMLLMLDAEGTPVILLAARS